MDEPNIAPAVLEGPLLEETFIFGTSLLRACSRGAAAVVRSWHFLGRPSDHVPARGSAARGCVPVALHSPCRITWVPDARILFSPLICVIKLLLLFSLSVYLSIFNPLFIGLFAVCSTTRMSHYGGAKFSFCSRRSVCVECVSLSIFSFLYPRIYPAIACCVCLPPSLSLRPHLSSL